MQANGVTTAMSLSACTQPPFVYNLDGYLSCDWKDAPPPRGSFYAKNADFILKTTVFC